MPISAGGKSAGKSSGDQVRSETYELPNGTISASIVYHVTVNDTPATVIAVDGKKLKYSSKNYCYEDCYTAGSITLDLRLDTALF